MFEQTVGLYIPLFYGNTVYYPASRQPPVILKTLQRHRIVTMVIVPQVLQMLLSGIEREVQRAGKERQWKRLHSVAQNLPMAMRRQLFRSVHSKLGGKLDFFLCGGAFLPTELADAWERMGIKVVQGYGATECSPIIASNTLMARVSGSVGRALNGIKVQLSEEGEIQVKGPNVTRGYWNADTETQAAYENGWYCTGDLAEMDGRGTCTSRAGSET